MEENREKCDSAELAVKSGNMPFPKVTFFFIATEFCERFAFYGMQSEFLVFGMIAICARCFSKAQSFFSRHHSVHALQIGLRFQHCCRFLLRFHSASVFPSYSGCHHIRQLARQIPNDFLVLCHLLLWQRTFVD